MVPTLLFASQLAFAQDLPPSLRFPRDAVGAALVSVVVGTSAVALGIEGPVHDRRIEAVGLRGGLGPAINLSPDSGGELFLGTFVAPYVRFGRQRIHMEGYVGPAVLLGSGASAAFVSGGAFEADLTEHLSLRAGSASYVSVSTALPGWGDETDTVRIGLSPELGVGLRW